MPKTPFSPAWQRALILLAGTVVGVVVIACLYWAQTIFIPVALAGFFTFLLSPIVTALQRRGVPRTPAVILVVLMATLVLGGTGWVVTRQVFGLIEELPQHTENIKGKVKNLRELAQGTGRLGHMIEEITGELNRAPAVEGPMPEPGQPPAVVVQPEKPAWMGWLPAALGSVAESFGELALAIVLVGFMLLKREDLRNRLIRLVGHGRVTLTTKAIDDAGVRISRFLLMQALVNGTYGVALALPLALFGVQYAFLWGFLAAVLRYIPYVGAWIAAIPPILLSFAISEGWTQPLLVVGMILVIELLSNMVMEPMLFGQSMGVSEVALLVSAAFWAWLWGPIGMVLSSPLTVCLVVLGKYVPQLEFLDVLLGDEPPLEPEVTYYQRLLARDQDEATQLVLEQGRESAEEVYDGLLLPALSFTRQDRERDDLAEVDEQFVYRATREILEDLGEQRAAALPAEAAEEREAAADVTRVRILGCPARDEADRLGLEMLQQLLDPARWDLEITAVETLTSELLTLVEEKQPALICVGSLPPGGLAHTRYLCKRLRARFPDVKIVVGRWGLRGNVERNKEQLREAGADEVETTLLDTRNHLVAWLPVLESEEKQAAAAVLTG